MWWDLVTKVASKVWSGAKVIGDTILAVVPPQHKADLDAEKKTIEEKLDRFENRFETLEMKHDYNRNLFAERHREQDEKKKCVLKKQERLRKFEDDLENRQRRKYMTEEDRYNDEEEAATLRKDISKELASCKEDHQILRKEEGESNREYAEHRKRLEENYETLKQNQSQIIERITSQPAIEKFKELNALTDVIMHNCVVYADDPEAQLNKTELMQNKYFIKLMEVRNIMLGGHFFPGCLKMYADGVILDLYMLGFLATNGVIKNSAVYKTKKLYQSYWDELKLDHVKHRPVTEGSRRLQEIDSFIKTQFAKFDSQMSASMSSGALQPVSGPRQLGMSHSSSNRDVGAAGDQCDRSLSLRHSGLEREEETSRRPPALGGERFRRGEDSSHSRDEDRLFNLPRGIASLSMENDGRDYSSWNDDWEVSEEQREATNSFARMLPVQSASGSAPNRGRTLTHGRRAEQRN